MKHFKNFPTGFEQYNPDAIKQYAAEYKTRDENKKLHSFNDEPSHVIIYSPGERQVAYWYSHGKLYRPYNNPVSISSTQGYMYRTNDEHGYSHSYNGLPAVIELRGDKLIVSWFSHGKKHRANGLPAEIVWQTSPWLEFFTLDEESYYYKGERHREGGLPALDSVSIKIWNVSNTRHNTSGSAYSQDYSNAQTHYQRWYLYGIQFSEELFNSFKQIEVTHTVPSWVAFLIALEMITLKDVELISNEKNKWNLNIPFAWALRSFGITEETFLKKLKTFASDYRFRINFVNTSLPKRSHFETFVKIVNSETGNKQFELSNKGKSYV